MSAATDAKTTVLAMHAVAQHMLDHQLPAPLGIDAPAACPRAARPRRVAVKVTRSGLDAWLDSMVVDDEHAEPVARTGGRHELVTYEGRIVCPVGEIAIEVLAIREAQTLTLVPGGAA